MNNVAIAGELIMRRHYPVDGTPYIEVLQADERIIVGDELLHELRDNGAQDGPARGTQVRAPQSPVTEPARLPIGFDFRGWTLRVTACNGVYEYRVDGYLWSANAWRAIRCASPDIP